MGQTGSEGVEMASEMGNIDGEMAKSHEAIDWETRGRWKVTRGDKQSGNPAAASERLPRRREMCLSAHQTKMGQN